MMNDFGSSARNKRNHFFASFETRKRLYQPAFARPHQKTGNLLKMRFFIAAVVAFATMTLDFEGFKLNYGLHGMTRSAFPVAAGYAGEEDRVEPAEHSVGTEAAAHPVETNGLSVDSEPVAEVEAPTPEPKKDFCVALREAAESSDIPVAFFARLLWQESRFQAFEVSRVGAQGVAQFMPATAAEVGLDDPFDPFQALPA